MSANTNIEWCDHTFNPWIGCQPTGPGCDHCYAAAWAKRYGRDFAARTRTSAANWSMPLRWNAQAEAFTAQHGRRQRVFCASLADVFDNQVDPQWRADLFTLIQQTPNLDWLLLTKRIGNVRGMLSELVHPHDPDLSLLDLMPLPNVWLGATIVNQAEADRDIHKLLEVPAHRRFLSMEPLLGPVDLRVIDIDSDREILPLKGTTHCVNSEGEPAEDLPRIDWVIVGGESGPGARPMHPDWARSLCDQCTEAGTPFLFKQWGEWGQWRYELVHEGPECAPTRAGYMPTRHYFRDESGVIKGLPVLKVGKKAAGRVLDGRTWDGAPAP